MKHTLALSVALLFPPLAAVCIGQDGEAPFHPPGMWTWDNWFAHDGAQWHAFYLQLPQAVGVDRRWKDNDFYKHVGHATSADLRVWQDQGPALCALSGTWNDRHIATGSIARHEGRWWMVFTGRGTRGDGAGLVVSDDLMTWQPAQSGPLFPLTGTWSGEVEGGVFVSTWMGEKRRWVGISDPYLVPEAGAEGWFTLVLCARVLDVPLARSGCLAVLKSRDLRRWENPSILAWPGCFERMETPQLWQRNGRWHLSFGGVLDKAWAEANPALLPEAARNRPSHQNYAYALPDPKGPAGEATLRHIAVPPGHYIMKVLNVTETEDVAIFTRTVGNHSGISRPYPVTYDSDHAIRIGAP